MLLATRNPAGQIHVLDLDLLPARRLELAGDVLYGDRPGVTAGDVLYGDLPGVTAGSRLGVGVRYMVAGVGAVLSYLVAVDCHSRGQEAVKIAAKGLDFRDRDKAVDRLAEALKVLYNADGVKPAQVESTVAQAPGIVDTYLAASEALRMREEASGELEGWSWTLTPEKTWEWSAAAQ
jgi:hypothetical protein